MPSLLRKLKPFILWYAISAILLTLFLMPVISLRLFRVPLFQSETALFAVKTALLSLPFLAAWLVLRAAAVTLTERRMAWLACLAATALCEVMHYWITDVGHAFPPEMIANNTEWQKSVHEGVLHLRQDYIPHSYRFLPDSIVHLIKWLAGGSFEFSRLAFRLLGNSVLFAVFYLYARIYLRGPAAIVVVLVLVTLYPITILRYAGQFTDPVSHLSFAFCLYCLARRYEPGFGPSLVVGIFAKESVAVMALCRAFYGPRRLQSFIIAGLYGTAALITVVAIRFVVNHGSFGYNRVSGVEPDHVITNLRGYLEWGPMYLVTLGLLVPGAVLGWRYMDNGFRATCAVVTVSVVISSLFFSWLVEIRNLVPAFLPLAVACLKYLEVRLTGPSPSIPVNENGLPSKAVPV